MAFLGDFGKFFTSGLGAVLLPVNPVNFISLARELGQGDSAGAKAVITGNPYVKAGVAAVALGSTSKRIDNPGARGGDTYINQGGGDSFQPTQFSGGSYDPGLGGGFPEEINAGGYSTWDYSTFSTPSQRPFQGGLGAMMEDWAADW